MKKKEENFANLKAGYTPIPNLMEEKRVGIHGKNAKIFTLILIVLLFIALINLAVSIYLLII